jgi:hypothetical protein
MALFLTLLYVCFASSLLLWSSMVKASFGFNSFQLQVPNSPSFFHDTTAFQATYPGLRLWNFHLPPFYLPNQYICITLKKVVILGH